MCRIAGIIAPGRADLAGAIGRMTETLRRGGPDDAGAYVDPDYPLALGHRRLSILDLSSAGHQPMRATLAPNGASGDDLWLTYNGELYNYQSLRDELRTLGPPFRTGTDTEVILRAYAQWGTDAFARFNGMFAFGLFDKRKKKLYLVRDHAGVKPLYYALGHGGPLPGPPPKGEGDVMPSPAAWLGGGLGHGGPLPGPPPKGEGDVMSSSAAWLPGEDTVSPGEGSFGSPWLPSQAAGEDITSPSPLGGGPGRGPTWPPALLFASETRAFRALDPAWPENPAWRTYFLAFGHLPEPVTTLQGVQMLPKAHYLEYDLASGATRLVRYHQFRISDDIRTERDAVEALRAGLLAAVQRQLVSDAPIGLFLSGGIDSSVLALAASHPALQPSSPLYTTSLAFEEAGYSEKPFQDAVLACTGAHNAVHTLTRADFEAHLPDALAAMDQPTNDGINAYFVSKYAREAGLKVALSGLGADELLGGYPSFDRGRQLPLHLPPAAQRLVADVARLPLPERLRKLAFLGLTNDTGRYLALRGLFAPADVAHLTHTSEAEVWRHLADLPVPPAEAGKPARDGNCISRLEQHYYMQNQLLKDTDAMSMWHGLEVRVPFLDRDFMQLVWSIAPEIKFGGPRKKHLLIQAFPELPRAVWDRPKMGFTFPFARWFRESDVFRAASPTLAAHVRRFHAGQLSWARLWVLFLAAKGACIGAHTATRASAA